jgi:uncharacterized protein
VALSAGFYKVLGFLMVVLAIVGIALPLVPATPFLLLAAGCFGKSSEKWHSWLLSNATFGPTIRSWEERRCVNCQTKIVALLSMLLLGGGSLYFAVHDLRLRILAAVLMTIGAAVVLGINTCSSGAESRSD